MPMRGERGCSHRGFGQLPSKVAPILSLTLRSECAASCPSGACINVENEGLEDTFVMEIWANGPKYEGAAY